MAAIRRRLPPKRGIADAASGGTVKASRMATTPSTKADAYFLGLTHRRRTSAVCRSTSRNRSTSCFLSGTYYQWQGVGQNGSAGVPLFEHEALACEVDPHRDRRTCADRIEWFSCEPLHRHFAIVEPPAHLAAQPDNVLLNGHHDVVLVTGTEPAPLGPYPQHGAWLMRQPSQAAIRPNGTDGHFRMQVSQVALSTARITHDG